MQDCCRRLQLLDIILLPIGGSNSVPRLRALGSGWRNTIRFYPQCSDQPTPRVMHATRFLPTPECLCDHLSHWRLISSTTHTPLCATRSVQRS